MCSMPAVEIHKFTSWGGALYRCDNTVVPAGNQSILQTIDHDPTFWSSHRQLFELMVGDGLRPFQIPKYPKGMALVLFRIIPCQRSRFKISPKFKSTRHSLQPQFSNIHIKKLELLKRSRWDRRSQISGLVSACLIMAFFVVSAGSILLRLIATSYTVIWDPTRLLMSTLFSRQRRSLDKWKSLPNFMKSMRTFLEKLPNRIPKIFGQLFELLN